MKYWKLSYKVSIEDNISFLKSKEFHFKEKDSRFYSKYDVWGNLIIWTYVPCGCSDEMIENIKNHLKTEVKYRLEQLIKQTEES